MTLVSRTVWMGRRSATSLGNGEAFSWQPASADSRESMEGVSPLSYLIGSLAWRADLRPSRKATARHGVSAAGGFTGGQGPTEGPPATRQGKEVLWPGNYRTNGATFVVLRYGRQGGRKTMVRGCRGESRSWAWADRAAARATAATCGKCRAERSHGRGGSCRFRPGASGWWRWWQAPRASARRRE